MAEFDFKNIAVFDDIKRKYEEFGYIIIRNILTKDEISRVRRAFDNPNGVMKNQFKLPSGGGRDVILSLWNNPGNDVTGMVARSEKIVNICEKLLGGEMFHFHAKAILKEPSVGGQFVWHQDYGYWYKQGFPYPDIMTISIAIDENTKENGCLQVLRGTHKCGRIDHGFYEGEQMADPERVSKLKEKHQLDDVELKQGDAILFQSNLLHTSGNNMSSRRRLAYAIAYAAAYNESVAEHPFACYNPIQKVPDSAITECENEEDLTGKVFLDPKKDVAIKAKQEQ
ncbi:L-proline trans-4-hydroxylase-like [Ylistrum balloti]|uniref:L-proline trans-4-hydroxylase-like n=1 Tax=Ylistrum balloti TaxID=509963 RepID=UPI002905D2BC|nr:L-proline trans-4-hydroxylase-like [Ylistrum balloti]